MIPVFAPAPARSAVLLSDAFAYLDGPLIDISGGLWLHHSGTVGDAGVSSNKLHLSQMKTEDVHALISGQPFATSSTNTLYAGFNIECSSLPSGPDGAYFAHFMNTATGYRCRLFATTNGAAAGAYRIGITSASNTVSESFPLDLELNSRHFLAVRYTVSTAESTLWIDPSTENDPGVTASDSGSPITVVAFAFRQAAGLGALAVDHLVVSDTFAELQSAIAPVARPPLLRFTNILENLVRPGEAPTNDFTELVLLPRERAILRVSIIDPQGSQPFIQTPTNGLPSTARWILESPGAAASTASLVIEAADTDAGHEYAPILEASNPAGTNCVAWRIYVPTAEEQQIILSEFLANPTSDSTARHFNPLHRDVPSTDPTTEDEYLELVNRSTRELDLQGWTIADALRVRHRFPSPCLVPASAAIVVYGGAAKGSPPNLDPRALAMSASEGSAGLALNNTGTETIILRNARSNLVARLVYTDRMLSSTGSLSRFPDLDSPFLAHSQISGLYASPGTQYDGRPFTDSPPAISEFRLLVQSDGTKRLSWEAVAGTTYTLWYTSELSAEFQILQPGLRFDTSLGSFADEPATSQSQRFYRLSTP